MITALIIGLGHIGLNYDLEGPSGSIMTHTGACLAHPEVNLIGGVDLKPSARALFEKFSKKPSFGSLPDAALAPRQVDLFIISTPTAIRLPIVAECLRLRPKAILLEKPIAGNAQEGAEIVKICSEAKVALAVNYFRRFEPRFIKLGEAIKKGRFGAPSHGSCVYSGGLIENGSHYVDLFLNWFGMPVKARTIDGQHGYDPSAGKGAFALEYRDFQILFHEIRSDYGIGEMDLFFERGRIRLVNYGEEFEMMESLPDPFFKSYRRLISNASLIGKPDMLRYQYHVVDHLVQSLVANTPFPSAGKSALDTLRVCLDVIREK